jgi:hypothetical protein
MRFLRIERRPDMATNVPQGSAQIFKFPPRGRFATDGNDSAQNRPANFTMQQAVIGGGGAAWYHDEAVREDEQPRKN